jgi:hypothetical protein
MPRIGAGILSCEARGRRITRVFRTLNSIFCTLLFAAIAALASDAAFGQPAPSLVIDAPAELASSRTRLESFDRASLGGIVRMVGLDDPGPPIHVILAAETAAAARNVSPSTAGFAISREGLIVLFPARSPAYPHDTLEDVMRHEVAHVLISRAARGYPVPRWFHEGLAMAAERPWGLEDRSRLIWELVGGPRLSVRDIDRLFDDDASRPRGYALSAALVRDIVGAHGAGAPAAILRGLGTGAGLDEAMAGAVGRPMRDVENEFWSRQRVWTVWVPLVTSGEVLWLLVIALAALAVWHRRKRAAAIRRRWDDEEAAAASDQDHDRSERSDD